MTGGGLPESATSTAARVDALLAAATRLRRPGVDQIAAFLAALAAGRPPGDGLRWGSEQLLLDLGQPFARKATPPALRGRPGQCFANARDAVAADPARWIYCEGLAVSAGGLFPVHHAWLVDAADGGAVELTWASAWAEPPGDSLYVGVPLAPGFMTAALAASGTVLHDDARRYPRLTGAAAPEVWLHPAFHGLLAPEDAAAGPARGRRGR